MRPARRRARTRERTPTAERVAEPGAARPSRRHAAPQEVVALGADPGAVAARVPGHAGRGVPLQTGQPRRGRARRGHGQILLGAEALHQPHHEAEIWKKIKPRDTDLRPIVERKHRKYSQI